VDRKECSKETVDTSIEDGDFISVVAHFYQGQICPQLQLRKSSESPSFFITAHKNHTYYRTSLAVGRSLVSNLWAYILSLLAGAMPLPV
jgi:hypothetical protein